MAVDFLKVGASERMRIRVIGNYGYVAEGRPRSPGEVFETTAADAMTFILTGKAEKVVAEAPKPPEPIEAEAETAEEAIPPEAKVEKKKGTKNG
jgi:hypothetical protein